jgi:hypothetical protein
MPERKPTIILDFDGVIHSYVSGWKGADQIPDDPVPGTAAALIEYVHAFNVAIFSSRTHQAGGVNAMRRYLVERVLTPYFQKLARARHGENDRFDKEWAHLEARWILEQIDFPTQKPPAIVSIDDRAITFKGVWPTTEAIEEFTPWNLPLPEV